MEPIGASEQRFDIGRALVFYRNPWDGTGSVFDGDGGSGSEDVMTHLGDTEGAITIAPNPEYSELTLPELSGPAAIKRYLKGEKPTFTLGVFPTPAMLGVLSPTGLSSAGQQRQRPVNEHTLWIVPEALFLKADVNGFMQRVAVSYAGGVFLKDGDPLTADEQELADLSILVWRADFQRITPMYSDADGGKALREVEVMCQQDFAKPDGCQLYLVLGELGQFAGLDLEGGS